MKRSLRRIGFWILLPVSLVQGLRLKKTAVRLPEATGIRIGVSGQGEPFHLLALGDSIIAGVGTGRVENSLPVQFAKALAKRQTCSVHWRIEGANGADIADLQRLIGGLDGDRTTDILLISIGVNDVTGLSSTRHWRVRLSRLVVDIRRKWPQALVIFLGIPPMGQFPLPPQPLRFALGLRAVTLDAISARVLEDQDNMLHIPTEIDPVHQDFCEDGFHPAAAACEIWAEGLVQKLKSDTLTT